MPPPDDGRKTGDVHTRTADQYVLPFARFRAYHEIKKVIYIADGFPHIFPFPCFVKNSHIVFPVVNAFL
jgi:hypothetical protein